MLSRASRYILVATVLFTALNVCVKHLPHIPTSQLVFFRGLVTLLMSTAYARSLNLPLLGVNKTILVLRGFFGTLSLFALFYCLQNMPLAVASVLSNLAPLFTVLIAHFFLKEKATWANAALLFVAFVGVYLVKGWDGSVSLHLTLIGVGGALSAACAYTCVRVLRTTDHPIIVVLYFPLISVPLMLYPTITNWISPSLKDWLFILCLGVLTQLAQYFMTMAYQLEVAAKVMIFNYASVVWSIVFGMFLFGEYLGARHIVGILIIFISIVFTAWMHKHKSDLKTQS